MDNIVSDKIRSMCESSKELLEWHPRIDIDNEKIHTYWGILTKEEKSLNMDRLNNYLVGSDLMALGVFEKGMEFLKRSKALKGYTCPVCEYISATIKKWEVHIRHCFWNPSPLLYELGILRNIEEHTSDDVEHHHGDIVVWENDDTIVIGEIKLLDDGWWDSIVKERKKAVLSDFIRLTVVVENLAAILTKQIGYLGILREVKKMGSPKSSLVELKHQLERKPSLNGFKRLKLILVTSIIDRAEATTRNKEIKDKKILMLFNIIRRNQK
ncbi:hypothetical protein OROGR_025229 [Orobanche gracilis]